MHALNAKYLLWKTIIEELLKRITLEAGKCVGRPCIRGMRIRVSDILELVGHGASIEEILEDYPSPEKEDISTALQFSTHQII